MCTMQWFPFGHDEHGTPTSKDGTSYIVHKGAEQERWEVIQHLNWPRNDGPIGRPPPPEARGVVRYAATLEEGKELAEQMERDRIT
jgi:hypothetical protein